MRFFHQLGTALPMFISLIVLAPNAQSAEIDQGLRLYADRCANCHGTTGEKKALGRSRKLHDMTSQEIEEKLLSYQLGQPAKSMKDRMKSGLTAEEIEAIAAFATEADN